MKKLLLLILVLFPFNVLAISAESSIVMDLDNGRILHQNNIDDKLLIASITKIMTTIVTIENIDLDKEVEVDDEVLKAYGSAIYIEVGERLRIYDLLMGLMLRSGNDAAIVIAKNVAGSMENFAKLMNNEAKKIGMNSSFFYNAHGLEEKDGKGNISTARDMALLTKYAMNNDKFREIFGTKKYTLKTNYKTYTWTSKNKLIHQYDFITGGKTGYTKKAHRTLVTTGSGNNINLVVVTLNDGNDFQDHISLYKEVFKKYESIKVLDKNIIIRDDNIYKNDNLYIKKEINIPVTKEEKKNIRIEYELFKNKKHQDNDIIGKVKVYIKDDLVREENIYINKQSKKKSIWQRLFGWLKW